MWYGMIRCALALIRRPERSMPLALRPSSSSLRTFGSITTPLPIAHSLPGERNTHADRWDFHITPPPPIVRPALLPPWKRITRSARSASRSVTLPLPSSPHCAPTMTKPAMSLSECTSGGGLPAGGGAARGLAVGRELRLRQLELLAVVGAAEQQRVAAHLDQPRHRALADLFAQLRFVEIGRDHDRPPVLVAGVDDRVELLEHPWRALLGPDIVDVEQVDGREAIEQDAERGL